MSDKEQDIDLIVNHPKKALINLSIPTIISLAFTMIYFIIDGIWVSGVGPNALAAVGFVTPLFTALAGFSNSLGSGANSLISRCIGAEQYENAENSAVHGIMLSIILTIVLTVGLLIILKPMFLMMGAEKVIEETMAYGNIIVGGIFTIFIPIMMSAIFRSQGDIKRATYPLVLAAAINLVLDPIFIYTLGWGVAGAAFATVLAAMIASTPMVYWMFIKNDGFLKINMRSYKTNLKIYKEILVVAIPVSLEQFSISFIFVLFNYWISLLSGTVAVAAFTAAWRLVALGNTPVSAIGMSALTVGGVAYGAHNLVNLKTALNYGIKLAMVFSVLIVSLLFIFADPLSWMFSFSQNSSVLAPHIAESLRILCFFTLLMPFGVLSCNIFQSMGKGTYSLLIIIVRAIVLEVIFSYLFAFVLGWGLSGIYWGMVAGMAVGSVVGYLFINYYLNKHKGYFKII